MIVQGTPVEYYRHHNLLVKREDLSCLPPGPPFSKTRGVYAHIAKRPERVIGVLDTYHSQAGHAVAEACSLLGKQCVNFYPKYKADPEFVLRPQQAAAEALGACVLPLQAGRSAVLYHGAKKRLVSEWPDSYMMPNALKLPEMVEETAAEVARTIPMLDDDWLKGHDPILIAISSGTIAAGVIRGFYDAGLVNHPFLLHMGYSRSEKQVLSYILEKVDRMHTDKCMKITLINEGYAYKDQAKLKEGDMPEWPCNSYYDLKAFLWWKKARMDATALMWNIG